MDSHNNPLNTIKRILNLEQPEKRKRIRTALIVLGGIALSVGIAAAIVFGGGIPLIPFVPLLAAVVVNPLAVMGVLTGFTAVGLTLLGSLIYGAVKLGKWIRNKQTKELSTTPPQSLPSTPTTTSSASSRSSNTSDAEEEELDSFNLSEIFEPTIVKQPPVSKVGLFGGSASTQSPLTTTSTLTSTPTPHVPPQ